MEPSRTKDQEVSTTGSLPILCKDPAADQVLEPTLSKDPAPNTMFCYKLYDSSSATGVVRIERQPLVTQGMPTREPRYEEI